MSEKRILAITLGGNEYPSSNFRLRQYYRLFQDQNYSVKEFNSMKAYKPKLPNIIGVRGILRRIGIQKILRKYYLYQLQNSLKQCDVVWINKLLRDKELVAIVKKSGKKVVVDFDDAEWISSGEAFKSTLSIADAAIAGNQYLANYANNNYTLKTIIVPTTIDLSKYPQEKKAKDSQFVLGWLGSHFTNDYLLLIKDAINEFLENTNAEFHVISSKFENLKTHFPSKTIFTEWKKEDFVNQIAQFNVGIMPMPDEEWVKGKCSFKMLQYMGAHVPVIVSPYGMNQEILNKVDCGFGAETKEEWMAALYRYYDDAKLQRSHGNHGRKLVENEFDINSNFFKIKELFDSL